MPPATVQKYLDDATRALAAAGIESPAREARLLLAHHLNLPSRTPIPPDSPLNTPGDLTAYAALIGRRAAHEPMAFITGTTGFWTLDLAVSPATLIPRPDSETLIDAALAAFPDRTKPYRILDLGTGTGCLLLAALSEFPASFGIGVDLNPAAVALAASNARLNNLQNRASFVAANWAAPLKTQFDLVLSNPPYIPTLDIAGLMPDVAQHEPRLALDGGADGLACYLALITAMPALLAIGGVAIFELGIGQAQTVSHLAQHAGFATTLRADLAGIGRALVLRK